VVQEGLDLEPYLQKPVVLWGHDPEQPIARAISAELIDGQLMAQIQFAPEGISCKADEIYGLVKAGILNTVSIGFDPIDAQPIDPANPKGPLKYITAEWRWCP
jgi:phage head maturation protease